MSSVRVLLEAALLSLLRKRELSSGVVALLCLVSMTDHSCTRSEKAENYMYISIHTYICNVIINNNNKFESCHLAGNTQSTTQSVFLTVCSHSLYATRCTSQYINGECSQGSWCMGPSLAPVSQ